MSRFSFKLILTLIFMNLIFQSSSTENNSQLIDNLTIRISKDEIYIDYAFEILSNDEEKINTQEGVNQTILANNEQIEYTKDQIYKSNL